MLIGDPTTRSVYWRKQNIVQLFLGIKTRQRRVSKCSRLIPLFLVLTLALQLLHLALSREKQVSISWQWKFKYYETHSSFLNFVVVSTNAWAVSPNGYFIHLLYRTGGDLLRNMEET